MSNFPDAHKVYAMADVFRQRVIEQGRSFLWPDREIWTQENAAKLLELESSLYVQGAEINIEQLAQALSKEDVEALMLAADVQAACHLFWASTTLALNTLVNAFAEQPGVPPVDEATWTQLTEQTPAEVPASWTTYKQTGIGWHLSVLSTIVSLKSIQSSNLDTASIEQALLNMPQHGVWYHHVWCFAHVIYPDLIPALPSEYARRLVNKRFAAEAGVNPDGGELTQLQAIREHLQPRVQDKFFDFYNPSILPEWETRKDQMRKWLQYERGGPVPDDIRRKLEGQHNPASASAPKPISVSHVVAERAPVYEIARQFKNRVIDGGKSLLWPEDDLWTAEAIDTFLTDFQSLPVEKGSSWMQNFEAYFSPDRLQSTRILADSYAFLMQFASMDSTNGATKSATLRRILSWAPEFEPNTNALNQITTAFGVGLGSPGQYFNINIQFQLAFVPGFVHNLRHMNTDSIHSVALQTANELRTKRSFAKSVIPAANIAQHLLEPEMYERIASQSDKNLIVERFSAQLDGIDVEADSDDQIAIIRERLARSFFRHDFDFYDADVRPFWLGDSLLEGEDGPEPPEPPIDTPPSIEELAERTYLGESFLRDIESLLLSRKQLIFEGPPGSGKTFVADLFARYFTGQSLDPTISSDQIELVQFHQSYSYEDFVEGIRPRTNESGQLVYDIEPGIFRNFAARAYANLDKKFVLIIDEINRGNISRILGELMLLLEYREKSARLPYSKEPLSIPPNLYILGTMNSADRSLSQIDYALRRRFYFVRLMAMTENRAPVLEGWLRNQKIDSAVANAILNTFIQLNLRLREHLETDDLQVGHSYFMVPNIHQESVREHVWKYAVIPLIREYLYHHRGRDELLESYELSSFSSIVEPIADDLGETAESLVRERIDGEYE